MSSIEMEYLKNTMKMMMEKGFAPKFDGSLDPSVLRNVIEAAQLQMQLPEGIQFRECELNGIPSEIAVMADESQDAVILYIHGGGFMCGNTKTSRAYAALLANDSGIPVQTLTYRLAPEDPYPAAVDDCFRAYQAFIQKNQEKNIFLVGESAGASLCLITALKALNENLRLPEGIILYSPLIDFSHALNRNFDKDFTITPEAADFVRRIYCRETDPKDPYVSPYYADLKGLCPVYLAWDESESLAADSETLYRKAAETGVEISVRSFTDCFHAFATAGKGTPESNTVLNETITFINRYRKAV